MDMDRLCARDADEDLRENALPNDEVAGGGLVCSVDDRAGRVADSDAGREAPGFMVLT